jgi:two-component system OmpR family sensor kinase/two-component system sensor histidine kinase BaeS
MPPERHETWRGHWREWHPDAGPPPWIHEKWRTHRRSFLRRVLIGLLALLGLVAGWMMLLAFMFAGWHGGGGPFMWQDRPGPPFVIFFWIGGLGLMLALPLLALTLAARVFRSYALPLADIMDAAESVANGDLDVRVEERGSREFQRLAHSFNRMTEELARTDRQRRNLTADVAHELRTPLHIIRGNLEGILDGVYAPTPEHIEATLQETRTLARLVDDLRTLSLAESGQLPLVLEPVDVADLLADVVTSFSAQAESAGIDLRCAADAATPLEIQGDAGRLDQVLSNLVSNALRHTPSGGRITLSAEAADGCVRLTVADTGEGIAPEDLPFVFDRFWRGDRARSHSGSTGLGLAIAAQLVRAHGGAIRVASRPGDGTTFTLDLPQPTPS